MVWDTERRRWFHLYPDQDLPPADALHWTGPYKTWNTRCAECHATGYDKNYDPATQSFASTQVEIGVGCEACHGPGGAHLAWAEAGGEGDDPGFTARFDSAEATVQQCAGCHSRREAWGDGNPLPGTPYHDAYNLSLLRPGLYHADGQIRDEVYEFGSFLQSRMYAQGVSCTNCHDPHSARLRAEGNAVCTQCHSPEGNAGFPQAAGVYDAPAHHFHEPGSEGAQCRNCHMTLRVYMGVDGRRDHSFRVPRPDLAAVTDAPDACTDCHEDRDARMGGRDDRRLVPREPPSRPALRRDAGARHRRPGEHGCGPRRARRGHCRARHRPRHRALAPRGGEQPLDRRAPRAAPRRPGPAGARGRRRAAAGGAAAGSRGAADRGARRPGAVGAHRRGPRAPRRAGREPARRDCAPASRRRWREWQAALATRLDFPETHLQIGGTALLLRNFPAASQAFHEAVALDPQLVDAWSMIVRIAAATEGAAAARAVLDNALAANPEDPTLRQYDAELPRP